MGAFTISIHRFKSFLHHRFVVLNLLSRMVNSLVGGFELKFLRGGELGAGERFIKFFLFFFTLLSIGKLDDTARFTNPLLYFFQYRHLRVQQVLDNIPCRFPFNTREDQIKSDIGFGQDISNATDIVASDVNKFCPRA